MRLELTQQAVERIEERRKERRLRIEDLPNAYKDILRRVKRKGKTLAFHTTIFDIARTIDIDIEELVEIDYDKLTDFELDELQEEHRRTLEEGTDTAELVGSFIGHNWL